VVIRMAVLQVFLHGACEVFDFDCKRAVRIITTSRVE
jgi:hypothetical protein